ncbi:M20/M25/M40 family metallo-hydrolase [Brevundimonas goettingensis]|uniref:Vacuolar membrane protease n=1 Tax=Brevundimonas goettingensis TaxID=2774190 RepID=A0A975C0L3_9CAUL|nr:M20/M25/M40 family metallo-hydrolase [Brevundimonas goettingensis]QTC91546.1 M20/M25/M40 family metallo-hydrolase [Brevundimonas goettingensis]
MRLALLLGSLALALFIGVIALQTPSPRGPETPATAFSTARAMTDVRIIAAKPHPLGTPEHEAVRGYLFGRMTALGLSPSLHAGPLEDFAKARLTKWGLDPSKPAISLVGVLPGRDPTKPAVVLMAHYDSVAKSPGAADDTAGVAAILEAVRAIKARGLADRDLIVLLTDGEELGLDGARNFFTTHPLRDRVGAIVNLEARGGGGRAMMFETGPGNRQTIDLFTRAAARADGGATSNSLAVLIYSLMPNGTDFTVPRKQGLPGINLAFIGRPAQYHSPTSTPDALDQGSVQHIGSQALEAADALLRAPALPARGESRVYADVLDHLIVAHAPATGWILIGLTAALFLFAVWGGRHAASQVAGGLTVADIGRGLLGGLWFLTTCLVLAQAVRLLAGPIASRVTSADTYYVLLRRLPWIEGGVALTVLAVALAALAGRDVVGRRVLAGLVVGAALLATVMGGFIPVLIGAAVIAAGLSLWSQAAPRSVWGGWLGLILLIGLLGAGAQAVAPEAAFLLTWPALAAAAAAALSAAIGARLVSKASLIPAAVVTVVGGGWIASLAHPIFLGIGMDLPGVLAPLGLLILMFVRPLAPPQVARALAGCAAACLIFACGVSMTARFAEPAEPPAASAG